MPTSSESAVSQRSLSIFLLRLNTQVKVQSQNTPARKEADSPLRYLGVEESSEGLSNNLTFLPLTVATATFRLFPYEMAKHPDMAGGVGSSFRHVITPAVLEDHIVPHHSSLGVDGGLSSTLRYKLPE